MTNTLDDLIVFANNVGFMQKEELVPFKQVYYRACCDYRTRNSEPVGIDARLEYASNAREYAYTITKKHIIKVIDEEHKNQTRLEL
jgi:hypothetical protein